MLLGLEAGGIRISPVEFDIGIQAGASATFNFEVFNDEAEPLEVSVGLCDWVRDIEGVNLFCEEAGEVARSATGWASITPNQFELEPGGTQQVRFTLTTPSGPLEGTYWTAVMVEAVPKQPEDRPGTEIVVKRRFAVKVYVTIANTGRLEGQVRDLERHGLNPLWVTLEFENRGTLNMREVEGRVEIRDATGATLETIPLEPFPVLPGYTRRLIAQSARPRGEVLPPGDYLILAILDFGGENLVGAQLILSVPTLELRPLGDAASPPADLDGDAFYEDVNGDGSLTLDDPSLLNQHLEEPVVQDNWPAFDYNNDGLVDFDDVLALKEMAEAP